MMKIFLVLITVFSFFLSVSFAFAKDQKSASDAPIEITADKALEWNQTAKTYTAKVNAIAKQGVLSIAADTLTATYAGKSGSTSDISLLEASGHVTLVSGEDTATGDKITYDLETGMAVLTGIDGIRPKLIQTGGKTLEADSVTVWTENGSFHHASADGKVVITSGTQVATGNKATYDVATTTAQLIGNVKIKQGNNWLEGERAEINTTTHISKITGQQNAGRVKGVFYPSKKN